MTKKTKTSKILSRQEKEQETLLDHLKRIPIIQVACEKSGIARATYYRWCRDNKRFKAMADKAMEEGEGFMNDLGESQLVTLMKDKHWPAIRYWLQHRHPKFNEGKRSDSGNQKITFHIIHY